MALASMILRQGLQRVLRPGSNVRISQVLSQCRTITAEAIRVKTLDEKVRDRTSTAAQLLKPQAEESFSPEMSLLVRQISQCAKQRDAAGALQLLEGQERHNVVVYNAVLNACAKAVEYEKALDLWNKMPEKELVSYNIMIGLCGSVKQLSKAVELWEEMLRSDLQPNILTYTAMMKAYGQSGQVEKAMDTFRAMKSVCEPDDFAFGAAMSVCARVGDYARTRELFVDMTTAGIAAGHHHFNSMLTSCAGHCDATTAEGVFKMMPAYKLAPRVEDYTALIACCRKDVERCRELLKEMQDLGLEPNKFTFEKLVQVELESGNKEQAGLLITQAKARYGNQITPRLMRNAESLGIL